MVQPRNVSRGRAADLHVEAQMIGVTVVEQSCHRQHATTLALAYLHGFSQRHAIYGKALSKVLKHCG